MAEAITSHKLAGPTTWNSPFQFRNGETAENKSVSRAFIWSSNRRDVDVNRCHFTCRISPMQLADDNYLSIFPLRRRKFVQLFELKTIEEQLHMLGWSALVLGVFRRTRCARSVNWYRNFQSPVCDMSVVLRIFAIARWPEVVNRPDRALYRR